MSEYTDDRMKPHEETWVAEKTHVRAIHKGAKMRFGGDMTAQGFHSAEHARLAAQAPAMARWMKKIAAHDDVGTTVDSSEQEEAKQILREAGVIS
jgi:hypothetical protein